MSTLCTNRTIYFSLTRCALSKSTEFCKGQRLGGSRILFNDDNSHGRNINTGGKMRGIRGTKFSDYFQGSLSS